MGQKYPEEEKRTMDMEICEETRFDDGVICLDFGEDVAPTTCNDSTYIEEMERAERMCENVERCARNSIDLWP